MSENLLVVTRFVQFAAVMLLFGGSLFPLYALSVDCPTVDKLLRKGAPPISALALLSAIAWLLLEGSLMSGDPHGFADPHILGTVLHSTEFGHIWQCRLMLLVLLVGFAAMGRRLLRTRYARGLAALSGLAVATLAGIGHGAMGTGWDAWVHLGNQAAHMLAASVWVGGLAALLALVFDAPDHNLLIHALRRFSAVGLAAVLVILASGLLNAWFLVGSINGLLYTTYGHVLMIKISFFLGMTGLALFNRLILMPRLTHGDRAEETLRLLVRSVVVEQIFALLVVASVSLLGTLAPAFDMHGMTM